MLEIGIRSEEDRILAGSLERVLAASADPAAGIRDLGLLALALPLSSGGLRADDAADAHELALVFAALGRGFVHDLALLQAVLGGGLLARCAPGDHHGTISAVIAGHQSIATALHEPGSRTDLFHGGTRATRHSRGWQLEGAKTLVLGGTSVSHILVLARLADAGPDDFALFLIDPAHEGAALSGYRLRDGTEAADLTLRGCIVAPEAMIAEGSAAREAIETQLALVRLCLVAEAAGLAQAVVQATSAYTAQRQQFGKPIGSFQVVQHRLADMAVAADQIAALIGETAADTANHNAITRAHRTAADLGMMVAKAGIQLHGGYGMTEDLPLGRALHRMMTIALLF